MQSFFQNGERRGELQFRDIQLAAAAETELLLAGVPDHEQHGAEQQQAHDGIQRVVVNGVRAARQLQLRLRPRAQACA